MRAPAATGEDFYPRIGVVDCQGSASQKSTLSCSYEIAQVIGNLPAPFPLAQEAAACLLALWLKKIESELGGEEDSVKTAGSALVKAEDF